MSIVTGRPLLSPHVSGPLQRRPHEPLLSFRARVMTFVTLVGWSTGSCSPGELQLGLRDEARTTLTRLIGLLEGSDPEYRSLLSAAQLELSRLDASGPASTRPSSASTSAGS